MLYYNHSFVQLCKEVFRDQMEEVVDIRGVHDWYNLMLGCRPRSADEDIQLQYSLQLRARADTTIDVRSKSAVSARVPWSAWHQIMPHPRLPETVLPTSDQEPDLAPSKSWPQFKEQIVPCLKKFYSRSYRHPVHIPPEERHEMMQFLRRGPPPASAPAWIDWDNNADDDMQSESADDSAADNDQRETARVPFSGPASIQSKKKNWKPFLAPRENPDGKKCRCEIFCAISDTRSHTYVYACLKVRQYDSPKSVTQGLPFKSQACYPRQHQCRRRCASQSARHTSHPG